MSTVLVVNGGDAEFDRLQTILEEAGCKAIWLPDPAEVIQFTRQAAPAVILLDPTSLGMGLHEAIRPLKQDTHTAPVPLLLLSDRSTTNLIDSLNTDADFVLEKPIHPKELATALHFLIGANRIG